MAIFWLQITENDLASVISILHVWASISCCFFFFFHCDCGNPALLPSGMQSVSGAAEEKHSRGCLEKSRHMLPLSFPAFSLAAFLVCFPCSLVISGRNRATSRWPYCHFPFSPVSLRFPLTVHFSIIHPSVLSSSCVCLCSSSSCLIFLETNYRALQEGKKTRGGAV